VESLLAKKRLTGSFHDLSPGDSLSLRSKVASVSGSVNRYGPDDLERFHQESAKRASRSEFARDRARIIHSFSLRKLAAKTQVAVPWADDFPRTRLSHSLECAQIGREIGEVLGADPDLIDTACLAHDLGHPPFGHNGEVALNKIAARAGGFEGNAQSFRILTRLESKSEANGKSIGLNLTRASLDAATKYPWPREEESNKFGVYGDDLQIFQWMRSQQIVGRKTSIEAQIMDWSDDIAYSVHDFEDGVVTGKIPVAAIAGEIDSIFKLAKSEFLPESEEAEFERAFMRLRDLSYWPKNFEPTRSQQAQLKNLTSLLIGRFASAAQELTRSVHGDGDLIRYQADLEIPESSRSEVALLKAISSHFVIKAESAKERYLNQQILLAELVERLLESAPMNIDPFFIDQWRASVGDEEKLRTVVDQVASMTDHGAIRAAADYSIAVATTLLDLERES
jgi:dGTPase